MAEFDNYKKNAIKERSQMIKYGNERMIVQLLEVVDNFERALTMAETDRDLKDSEWNEHDLFGADELTGSFWGFGFRPLGQPFNPEEHEALSSEATKDVEPGHVFRTFKKPIAFTTS